MDASAGDGILKSEFCYGARWPVAVRLVCCFLSLGLVTVACDPGPKSDSSEGALKSPALSDVPAQETRLLAPSPIEGAGIQSVGLGDPGPSLVGLCRKAAIALAFAVPCPTRVPAEPGGQLRPPRCLASEGPNRVGVADPEAGDLDCEVGDWYLQDLSFLARSGDSNSEGAIVISGVPRGATGGDRLCSTEVVSREEIRLDAGVSATELSCPWGSWDYGEGPWVSLRWTIESVIYEVTAGLSAPGQDTDLVRELALAVANRLMLVGP